MTIFSALSAGMALASVAKAKERRFRELTDADMTGAQRAVYQGIASGPRGGVRDPFNALLRSPELADRVQKVGEYIRFQSSLPARLNELAILVTARHWSAQFEWYAHHLLAMKAGLDPDIAADLAQGKRPRGMKDDEAVVFDFCMELHQKKSVSDATYMAALEKLGERGIVDLIGVAGYYTLVSMVLNVDRHPLPAGVPPPLQALE
jgi:4-carboxymuconolactone decarboxylase